MGLSNIPKNLVVCLDILWDQVLKVFHGFIYMYMHVCFHLCFVFSCYVWMFQMYIKCVRMYVFLHMYICICVYICVHQCAYMLCVYVCVGTHFCSYKSYLIFCLVDIQVIQISASFKFQNSNTIIHTKLTIYLLIYFELPVHDFHGSDFSQMSLVPSSTQVDHVHYLHQCSMLLSLLSLLCSMFYVVFLCP